MVQAVQSLLDQTLDRGRFEILIVDNNSTDDTAERARRLGEDHSHVRCLSELQQGLSSARNCGWRGARGTFVGFLDDDAKAPPEWLSVAEEVVQAHDPDIFGGPYYPFYEGSKPRWFRDAYGSREMATGPGYLTGDKTLSGSNIFFRRQLLEEVGGFDPRFGMTGEKVWYGEETALQLSIRRTHPGSQSYYEPRLYVEHLVRQQKMTLAWTVREFFNRGRAVESLVQSQDRSSGIPEQTAVAAVKQIGLCVARLGFYNTYRLAMRDRRRFPRIENFLYEVGFVPITRLGGSFERWFG
jgi:glucosyl-dolichyl phosphate glucuronosyltransferase